MDLTAVWWPLRARHRSSPHSSINSLKPTRSIAARNQIFAARDFRSPPPQNHCGDGIPVAPLQSIFYLYRSFLGIFRPLLAGYICVDILKNYSLFARVSKALLSSPLSLCCSLRCAHNTISAVGFVDRLAPWTFIKVGCGYKNTVSIYRSR